MKLFLAASVLFASYASAFYLPGQPCKNDDECTRECFLSVYIQPILGIFFCSPPKADPVQFYDAKCGEVLEGDGEKSYLTLERATDKACETVKGTKCFIGCVISGKKSVEKSTQSEFEKACKSQEKSLETKLEAKIETFDTEDKAKKDAGDDCKVTGATTAMTV